MQSFLRGTRTGAPQQGSESPGQVPDSAPPEYLQAEVDRASRRYDELQADGRELHFGKDPVTGRVLIEVRDLKGNLIRTIPPSKALDVISGESLEC
jgi:uncharacterized FlaG/YvyC family protein